MQHDGQGPALFWDAAEVFSTRKASGWSHTPMQYRRFGSLALAVKFVVEEIGMSGGRVTIRTDRAEYKGKSIRDLYDQADFPLARTA